MFHREFLTSSSEESSSDVEEYALADLSQEPAVLGTTSHLPTMQARKDLLQAQRHKLTRACQIVVSINDGVPQHQRPVVRQKQRPVQPEDPLEEVKLVDVTPALNFDAGPARLNWFEDSPRSASTEELASSQEFPAPPEPSPCLLWSSAEPLQASIPLEPDSPRSVSTEEFVICQEFPAPPEPRTYLVPSPEPLPAFIPLEPAVQYSPRSASTEDLLIREEFPTPPEPSGSITFLPEPLQPSMPLVPALQTSMQPISQPRPIHPTSSAVPQQLIPRTVPEYIRSHIHEFKCLLLSPLMSGLWFRCTLKRDKSSLSKKLWARYHLFLNENWVFLFGACKRRWNKSANYMITNSLDRFQKNSESYLGKLRKQGDRYVVYDNGARPTSKHSGQVRRELASIHLGCGAQNHTRSAAVLLPIKPALRSLEELFRQGEEVEALVNASQSTAGTLDQSSKVQWRHRWAESAPTNLQLAGNSNPGEVLFEFVKTGEDHYSLEFTYPFSPIQAFGIALSSLDNP